jgi:hypothetical protein
MVFAPVSKNADNRISPGEQLSSHCVSTMWRLTATQSTAPTCAKGKPVGRRGFELPEQTRQPLDAYLRGSASRGSWADDLALVP